MFQCIIDQFLNDAVAHKLRVGGEAIEGSRENQTRLNGHGRPNSRQKFYQGGATADLRERAGGEKLGVTPVRGALEGPSRQLPQTAGVEGGVCVQKVKSLPAGQSRNALSEWYVDLVAAGIVDPVKVTRSAVRNAASIASMLLTTETLVADKPADEEPASHGGHGHSH